MKERVSPLKSASQEEYRDVVAIEAFDAAKHSADEIALRHLEIRQWEEATGQNNFDDIMDSQADLRNLAANYLENGGQFFVATCSHGETVGFIGLKFDGEVAELKRLAVIPDLQDQGIDNRLVALAVNCARQKNCLKIRLVTGRNEQQAQGTYCKYGFREADYGDAGLIMELDLSV